jgi:hypothetical protein
VLKCWVGKKGAGRESIRAMKAFNARVTSRATPLSTNVDWSCRVGTGTDAPTGEAGLTAGTVPPNEDPKSEGPHPESGHNDVLDSEVVDLEPTWPDGTSRVRGHAQLPDPTSRTNLQLTNR